MLSASSSPFPDLGYPLGGVSGGGWNLEGSTSDANVGVVVQAATGGVVAPFEGSQFARFNRTSGGDAIVYGDFSTLPAAGNVLRVEAMIYVPSTYETNAYGAQIAIKQGGPSGWSQAPNPKTSAPGNLNQIVHYDIDVGGYVDVGVPFQFDVWEKWTMEFEVGGTVIDLFSIGSNSVTNVTGAAVAGDSSIGVWFGMQSDSEFFVDAVPEPSALVLLGCGLISLAFWRKRR